MSMSTPPSLLPYSGVAEINHQAATRSSDEVVQLHDDISIAEDSVQYRVTSYVLLCGLPLILLVLGQDLMRVPHRTM